MTVDDLISSILLTAVKKAIKADYGYCDLMYSVKVAIVQAIEDGYVFEDYLNYIHEVEDELALGYSQDEWIDIIAKAFENRGLDFVKIVREQAAINHMISDAVSSAMEKGEIVVNTTMDEIIRRAFAQADVENRATDVG